jgi:hypothetical protein
MAAYANGGYDDDDHYDDDGKDNGDYSRSMTEQEIKQSNEGSNSSTNVNCAENDINSPPTFDVQVCGTLDISSIGG